MEKQYNALFVGEASIDCFIGTVEINAEGKKRMGDMDIHVPESVRTSPEFRNVLYGSPQFCDDKFQVWLLSEFERKALIDKIRSTN